MDKWRILVVDDEPLNLEIIREYLDDPRYEAHFASDALEALAHLEAPEGMVDVLVLDRMMPGMDGVALLRRLKADARFKDIPVIMQTAAAAPDQVREGIEAGAYYYLTKPYEPEALLAILRAALGDLAERRRAAAVSASYAEAIGLMETAEFRFRTLDEAHRLAALLATLCPEREAAAMGLAELMINAVEHGNLAISYAEKAALKKEDRWEGEIVRRLGLPDYGQRVASVAVARCAGDVVFTIADEGDGFEWSAYLDFDPARAFDPNGRGIAMARQLCFDRLEYRERGNIVVAVIAVRR